MKALQQVNRNCGTKPVPEKFRKIVYVIRKPLIGVSTGGGPGHKIFCLPCEAAVCKIKILKEYSLSQTPIPNPPYPLNPHDHHSSNSRKNLVIHDAPFHRASLS
jgi:hypothetical protein